jgi:heme exporter protein CcmD
MSWATQVVTAYVAVFAILAGYAASVIVRGRRLSRELPPEERRWM